MGTNRNFNYKKAEADLFDAGARHPEEIYEYSSEKSIRGHMKEHGLNPDKYFKADHSDNKPQNNNSECYLTTACVRAKHLPDHCAELETLRTFRDDVLAHRPEGLKEIERYYQMAPGIVESINARMDSGEIWNHVYDELVAPCVRLIQEGQNEEAFQMYRAYSLKLGEKYTH